MTPFMHHITIFRQPRVVGAFLLVLVGLFFFGQVQQDKSQSAMNESSYLSYTLRSMERLREVGELQERIFELERSQFEDDIAHNSTSWLAVYDGFDEWIATVVTTD